MTLLRTSDNRSRLDIPEATCTVCAKPYIRFNTMQVVCGVACARRVPVIAKNTLKAQAKAERAETKARKEVAKPRSKWLAEAQQAVNAWVRARDKFAEYGCISCGTKQGKENAGHYLSVGARPELRFEPANIHLQCERCNTHLHGNLIDYRAALRQRIGPTLVDWLEGPHAPKKYTVDDLRAIIALYRGKLKEIAS